MYIIKRATIFKEQLILLATCILFIYFHRNNFFVFDNIVQISVPANFFYFNNFDEFYLPNQVATGHPTFVGMYFALGWKIFGRSIQVSHWILLPFIYGFLHQLYKFIKNLGLNSNHTLAVFCLCTLDATLISILSLLTFDIVTLFFLLSCFYNIIKQQSFWLSISFSCLLLTSMRGTLLGGAVVLFLLIHSVFYKREKWLSITLAFIPGIIACLTFFFLFYQEKGWIVHNRVSNNWPESSEFATLPELIKNIFSFGWHLVSYGKIFIYIILGAIALKIWKHKIKLDMKERLIGIILMSVFFLLFPLILYKSLLLPKYLIPIGIFSTIFTSFFIIKRYPKYIKLYFLIAYLTTFSGYFYFRNNQSWEATPAHWPYYELRLEMLDYMNKNKIAIDKTTSYFPNLQPLSLIDLNNDKSCFSKPDFLSQSTHVFYSNIFHIDHELRKTLFESKNWRMRKILKKGVVKIILFEKVNF